MLFGFKLNFLKFYDAKIHPFLILTKFFLNFNIIFFLPLMLKINKLGPSIHTGSQLKVLK